GRARPDRHEAVRDGPQAADLLGLVRSADRALDEEHVERPGRPPRCRLGELDEVDPLSDREQLVLEVEQGQLAAVARGELHDPDPGSTGGRRPRTSTTGCDRRAGVHQSPSRPNAKPRSSTENTGPSRHTKNGPSWQCPQVPTPHAMFRSSVSHVAAGSTPSLASVAAAACIIRSGPHTKAVTREPSQVARSNSWVTMPTRPSHSGPARSTISATSRSARPASAFISATKSRSRGVRAPR